MEKAWLMTWAWSTTLSFMNTWISSPTSCWLMFHTMGSRYIVMQESFEL